jgi:hypothetical protein
MRKVLTIFLVLSGLAARAQKVDSISFNLYTDSLKKGVYNYINVDGKLTNGTFLPLMSDQVTFTSSAGKWDGNSIILDTAFKEDSVVITATLKERPEVKKNITVYIKKIVTEPPLKTEKELMEDWRKQGRRKN